VTDANWKNGIVERFLPRGSLPCGRNGGTEPQKIVVGAESADLTPDDFGETAGMPERLTGVDVRHVEFDDRHGEDGQRIAFAEAVMCPGTGINEHGVQLVGEPSVNPFAVRTGTLPRARGHCVFDCPVPIPTFTVKQRWHARYHQEPGNVWLRGIIATLFAQRAVRGAAAARRQHQGNPQND
jgi:hypothetical protein